MSDEKDKIAILLAEYKNQSDWQRHNENQRAQLASILLAISAALITIIPKDRTLTPNDWPIPALLIVIGVFGILAVMKYWERFLNHVRYGAVYRKMLEAYFEDNAVGKSRKKAKEEHNRGWRPLFKDRHLMQHWLWEGVFALIALLGVYFLAKSFSWF